MSGDEAEQTDVSEERIIERMAKRIEAKLMASLESRFRSATGESSSAGVPGTSETGVVEKRKEVVVPRLGLEPSVDGLPVLPAFQVTGDQEPVPVRTSEPDGAGAVNKLLTSGLQMLDWLPQGSGGIRPPQVSIGNGLPPLPKKLVERIQRLEYVDMAELRPIQWEELSEIESEAQKFVILPGLEVARARRKPVEDIHTWSMCFVVYMAAVVQKHPEMVGDLLAYMLQILKAHTEYADQAWREYDVRFRQVAAVSGIKNWSQLDAQIYNQCFVGRARRAALRPAEHSQMPSSSRAGHEQRVGKIKGDVCIKFNRNGVCPYDALCRYRHACSECGGRHPSSKCRGKERK